MITYLRRGGDDLSALSEVATPDGTGSWTPARVFLLVVALLLIVLGGVGFLYNATFPIGAAEARAEESAHTFGIFETNGWHNAAGVGVGLLALYFTLRPAWAREAALGIGVAHVGLTAALMIWDPSTFWIASNAADQWVHASTAVGGIVCGLATPRSATR